QGCAAAAAAGAARGNYLDTDRQSRVVGRRAVFPKWWTGRASVTADRPDKGEVFDNRKLMRRECEAHRSFPIRIHHTVSIEVKRKSAPAADLNLATHVLPARAENAM